MILGEKSIEGFCDVILSDPIPLYSMDCSE